MAYKNYAAATKATPQTKPIPGRKAEMVKNQAGGYAFKENDWSALDRFLILGSEGGTFYVGEQELTEANAEVVIRCAKQDAAKTVAEIVRVSNEGLAPKNDPAIFALALVIAHADDEGRKVAQDAITKVCRIPTHLFMLVELIDKLKGWSRSRRKAIANWYLSADRATPGKLAEHLVKYRQRNGWTHRDVLRLSHPETTDTQRRALLRFAVSPDSVTEGKLKGEPIFKIDIAGRGADKKRWEILPPIVQGYLLAQKEKADYPALIRDYGLPREALPTTALNDVAVWKALNERMPITASIRNLAKMTRVGLLNDKAEVKRLVERITDQSILQKGRVHPFAILTALRTYAAGRGEMSDATWTPNAKIIDALDEAYELAFKYAEPTGLDYLVAVDVSGSMGGGMARVSGGMKAAGQVGFRPCELAAAVMHYIVRTEANVETLGFDTRVHQFSVSKRQRLDDVLATVSKHGGGGTDTAQMMKHALRNKLKFDVLVCVTDMESWAGDQHATQAFDEYKKKVNPKAKLVWLATQASMGSTLVDPEDRAQLGIAGFDASVGQLMAAFAKG